MPPVYWGHLWLQAQCGMTHNLWLLLMHNAIQAFCLLYYKPSYWGWGDAPLWVLLNSKPLLYKHVKISITECGRTAVRVRNSSSVSSIIDIIRPGWVLWQVTAGPMSTSFSWLSRCNLFSPMGSCCHPPWRQQVHSRHMHVTIVTILPVLTHDVSCFRKCTVAHIVLHLYGNDDKRESGDGSLLHIQVRMHQGRKKG